MEIERTLSPCAGVRIHYRIWNPPASSAPAPTLVLLHGVASNLTRWTEFLNNTTLKETCRIIRLDLRGHARSQTLKGVNLRNWCKDVIAILDAETIDRAYIVGHSLGAQIALNLAYRSPQRLSGMVLIDPVVPGALRGYLAIGPRIRWLFIVAAEVLAIAHRLGLGPRTYPIRDLFELDRRTREQITADASRNLADLYHAPGRDIVYIPIANYVRDMLTVAKPLPPLEELFTPALTLLAQNPSISDAAANRRAMQRLPNNEIVTIHADHWPLTERPDETREAIERWCKRQFD